MTPKSATDDRLMLSAPELARVLSVSRATIYRLVAAGELPPPVHVGSRAIWPRDDAEQYVARLVAQRDQDAAT